LDKTSLLAEKTRSLTGPRILRPIRDGKLIREDEQVAYSAGRFAAVPTLVGTNAYEGETFVSNWPVKEMKGFETLLPKEFGAFSARAAALYRARSAVDVQSELAHLFGDTQFNFGTVALAKALAKAGQPVFRYLFNFRSEGTTSGPNHGDEGAYAFGTLNLV